MRNKWNLIELRRIQNNTIKFKHEYKVDKKYSYIMMQGKRKFCQHYTSLLYEILAVYDKLKT